MLAPPAALMQPCGAPALLATVNVRAMQDNLLAWKGAYEMCAARMRCLVDWIKSAQAGKTVADCKSVRSP